MRTVISIVSLLVFVLAVPVVAQTNSNLVTDTGSTVTAQVDVAITTSSYGTLSGTDTDTTASTGMATISLLPTGGPYEDIILHDFSLELGQANFSYSWIFGLVTLNVTLSNMSMSIVEPVASAIEPDGTVDFTGVPFHGAGNARVQVAILGVDETYPIDNVVEGDFSLRVTTDSQYVTIDNISIPPLSQDMDPEDLPSGVSAIHIEADIDAANTTFTGELWDGDYGDANADDSIDLDDYAIFSECMQGPGVEVSLMCSLLDADEDLDIDLFDFAEFQVVFEGAN